MCPLLVRFTTHFRGVVCALAQIWGCWEWSERSKSLGSARNRVSIYSLDSSEWNFKAERQTSHSSSNSSFWVELSEYLQPKLKSEAVSDGIFTLLTLRKIPPLFTPRDTQGRKPYALLTRCFLQLGVKFSASRRRRSVNQRSCGKKRADTSARSSGTRRTSSRLHRPSGSYSDEDKF